MYACISNSDKQISTGTYYASIYYNRCTYESVRNYQVLITSTFYAERASTAVHSVQALRTSMSIRAYQGPGIYLV